MMCAFVWIPHDKPLGNEYPTGRGAQDVRCGGRSAGSLALCGALGACRSRGRVSAGASTWGQRWSPSVRVIYSCGHRNRVAGATLPPAVKKKWGCHHLALLVTRLLQLVCASHRHFKGLVVPMPKGKIKKSFSWEDIQLRPWNGVFRS